MARRIARSATTDGVPTPDAEAALTPSRSRRSTNGSGAIPDDYTPPTHEQIATRAYQLFLARGSEHGYDQEDWLRAEQELRNTDPMFATQTRERREG